MKYAFRLHLMVSWSKIGGRWSKNCQFLSTFKIKNVHVKIGGGQKRAKLRPRSTVEYGHKITKTQSDNTRTTISMYNFMFFYTF